MDPHVMSFTRFRSYFFFGLIFILAAFVLYIFRPFAYPIFWAGVIAIMFQPVYSFIEKYVKIPSVSSFITVILVIVTLLLPLLLVSTLIVQEASDLYGRAVEGNFLSVENVTNRLESTPLGPYLHTIETEWSERAPTAARSVSLFIFENLSALTQNSLRFIFLLFIMLYTLFFFLKDGSRILSRIMHLSPLGDKSESMLYQRFRSTTRATLKSTLTLGLLQGTLGGILFAATGIEGALIWGVIMTLCSIIPAVGSFIVWLPAGVVMLALGHITQGVIILLVGAIVISNIDNILRPILVGKDTEMHPLFVLFSSLGGIFVFGVSGFIIGPAIMALFLSILGMYDQYYEKELENN